MAINTDAIDRRHRNAMKHFGGEVTYSGEVYDCLPVSMRDTELRNRDQTFRTDYRASISVIRDDVTIEDGSVVTYKGTVRRVLAHSDTGDGLQRVLHLGQRYGG